VTELGQQNGNLNPQLLAETRKCPNFHHFRTSTPANLDSSDVKYEFSSEVTLGLVQNKTG
jgi:hypothetical protein